MKHNNNHFFVRTLAVALTLCLLVGMTACGGKAASSPLDPTSPVSITVWNYYNGAQQAAFDELVSDFNETVGVEQGIVVTSVGQSDINTLADELLNSVNGNVGAQELPDMASVYAETAYILAQQDLLVDLDTYFTADQLAEYVPGFIEEGRLEADGPLYIFPVSKSTEVLEVNTTDWADFEAESGIAPESITTMEEMVDAAKAYYEWTDAKTPSVPNDGKALFGRDSMANYLIIGAAQLGHPLFTVKDGTVTTDFDKETFRDLWDNYYIPTINGYFGAYAKFRSDDAKMGQLLSLVGSSTSVGYFPTEVTNENDETHAIETGIYTSLTFENGEDIYVQQGAGYVVLKSDEARQYASSVFLSWLTDTEQNLNFSVGSGYSPVKIAANDATLVDEAFAAQDESARNENVHAALSISTNLFTTANTYVQKPFAGAKDVRAYLDTCLSDIAKADRATVEERLANGMSLVEATADFTEDSYFDAWYEETCTTLKGLVQ